MSLPATSPRRSKPAVRPRTPRLAEATVLAWLLAHPGFLRRHGAVLAALPAKSGNLLSLHAARAARAETTAGRLALRHRRLLNLAAENTRIADGIFQAVLGLLACTSLPGLRTYLQTRLPAQLGVEAVRLLLVAPTASATTLTAAELATLAPQPVRLRHLAGAAERGFYGPKGKHLQSDCLLRLSHEGQDIGLLALASRRPEQFHAGQSTELAAFLGAVAALCVVRLHKAP